MIFKNSYSVNCFLNKKQFLWDKGSFGQKAPFGKNAPVTTIPDPLVGKARQVIGISMNASKAYPHIAHKEISNNTYYSQYLLYRFSKEGSLNLSNQKSVPSGNTLGEEKYHSFYRTSMDGLPGLGLGYNALNPVAKHSFGKKEKLKNIFPYRKSFFCYWLLPFVGFVYIVELPSQFFNRLSNSFGGAESVGVNNVWVVGRDKGRLPVPLAQRAAGFSQLTETHGNVHSHVKKGSFAGRGDYTLQPYGQRFGQKNSKRTYTTGIRSGETLVPWGLYYFASLENSLTEKGLNTKPSHGVLLTGKTNNMSQNTNSYSLNYENLFNWGGDPEGEGVLRKNAVVVMPESMKLNFHLKMSLFPFLESSLLKNGNNKTLISVGKDYMKDNSTFLPHACQADSTLENPISSFRKASALLDMYSKIQSNKTVSFLPKIPTVASIVENYDDPVDPDRLTSINGEKRYMSGAEPAGLGFKIFSPKEDLYSFGKFFSSQNLLSKSSLLFPLYPNLDGALPHEKHSKVDLSSKNSFTYLFLLEGLSQGEIFNLKDEKDRFVSGSYALLSKENLYRFLLNSFNTSAPGTSKGHNFRASKPSNALPAPLGQINPFLRGLEIPLAEGQGGAENNKPYLSSIDKALQGINNNSPTNKGWECFAQKGHSGIVKYSHPILMSLFDKKLLRKGALERREHTHSLKTESTMVPPEGVSSPKAVQDPMLVNFTLKEQSSSVKVHENLFFKESTGRNNLLWNQKNKSLENGSFGTVSASGHSRKNPQVQNTKTPINNFNDLRKSVTFYESLVKDSILSNKEWNKKPEALQSPSREGAPWPEARGGALHEQDFPLREKNGSGESSFGSVSKIEKLLRAFFCLKKSPPETLGPKGSLAKTNTQVRRGVFLKENGSLLKDKMLKCIINMPGSGHTTSPGLRFRLSRTFGTYGKRAFAKHSLRALNEKLRIYPAGSKALGVNLKNKSWLFLTGGKDSFALSPSSSQFPIKSSLAPSGKKTFSPRLLLKNRFLILNKSQGARMALELYPIGFERFGAVEGGENNVFIKSFGKTIGESLKNNKTPFEGVKSQLEENSPLFNVSKYNQKKRRLKKLKKETRRRKKRKRFYPRPIWIRYRLYQKVLKDRYYLKKDNKEFAPLDGLGAVPSETQSLRYKLYRNYLTNPTPAKQDSAPFGKNTPSPYGSAGGLSLNGMVHNYKISPSVRGDLKRALWKSYWLRSNLNPYLKKVETALNGIEQSTKSWEYFTSLRTFIFYFLGFNIDNYHLKGGLNLREESLKQEYSSKNNIYAYAAQAPEGVYPNRLLNAPSEGDHLNKWQTALYLAEYNRVSYVRIQQFISQIRENLTLNGQVKPHSRKISPLIHSITQTTKRSSAKDSGFILNPERLRKISSLLNGTPQSRIYMPSAAQLRFYWAFSKTSYGELNEYNKTPSEKKWNATKNREQTKNNKTKKIYKEIKTKLENFLNERSFLLSSVQALALGATTPNPTANVSNHSLKTLPPSERASQMEQLSSLVYGSKSDKANTPSGENPFGGHLASLWGSFTGFDSLSGKNIQGGNDNVLWDKNPVRLFNLLENALRKTRMKEEKSQLLGYSKSFEKVPNNIFVPKDSINNSSYEGILNEQYMSRYSILTSKSSFWWSGSKAFPEGDTFYERGYLNKEGLELMSGGLGTEGYSPVTKTHFFLNEKNVSRLWISALLFHFCAILSILSISQIRGLLKIYLYAISKIYKTSLQILGLALSSFSRILLFQPTTSQSSSRATGFKAYNRPGHNPLVSGGSMYQISGGPSPQPDMLSRHGNMMSIKNGTSPSSKKSFSFLRMNHKRRSSTVDGHSANSWSRAGYGSTGHTYDLGVRNFYTFTQSLNRSSSNLDPGDTGTHMFDPQIQTYTPGQSMYPNLGGSGYYSDRNLFFKTLYLFIWSCLKKPIYLYKKSSKSLLPWEKPLKGDWPGNEPGPLGQRPREEGIKPLSQSVKDEGAKIPVGKVSKMERLKTYTTLRSLVVMNLLIDNSFNFYTRTASVLKETKLVLFEGSLRYLYSFLEKPGELIVDWIAYLFLVEWASDITNTIPENIDYVLGYTSYKITRNLYFQNAYTVLDLVKTSLQISDFSNSPSFFNFFNIGRSFIQHRIYHLYEILLLIFYQPDTDLIVRQKKGVIFWDIWGDYLKVVAEDSNINISELTSVKEEQIKLLSKCETFKPLDEDGGLGSFGTIDPLNPIFTWHRLRSSKMVEKASPSLNFIPSALPDPSSRGQKKVGNLLGNRDYDWNLRYANLGPLFTNGDTRVLGSHSQSHYASWGAQQFLSYQGKDTELFIDLHPRGALEQLCLLKDNSSIIQPIGSLVCQIFSGLLSKQISKNMLVVGSYNNRIEKTLLVQAIAGETELKIVVDSAYRYAMVYRGVAVGIKLLRDVFDSLVATGPPCLFLIEDIHAIGERRPMLISDDENSVKEGFTGALSEEIHEKNQVLYSLSKHMITHYKKPYKGDFSLLIPTNLYSFDFFLGLDSREGNNIYPSRKHPVSPPLSLKEKESSVSFERKRQEIGGNQKSAEGVLRTKNPLSLSRLLIKSSELLAPPATSPFSVLTLKEEKKFKPTKLVSEMPWAGLPGEQYASLISSKASYSIRVKVALLADMAISSLSVKLDMITDLLVIIDSVKGNRGFVVFATTHVPYILDPALRRPGRFDETISLGLFPTVFSRWEVLKSSFATLNYGFSPLQSYGLSVDFSLYLKSGFTFRNLQNSPDPSPLYINQTRRILFNSISGKKPPLSKQNPSSHTKPKGVFHLMDYGYPDNSKSRFSLKEAVPSCEVPSSEKTYSKRKPLRGKIYPEKRKLLSQTYYLASLLLFKTHRNNKSPSMGETSRLLGLEGLLDLTPGLLHENSRFISLYASPQEFKNHSIHYIVGKLGEIFLETSSSEVPRDPGGSPTGIYSTFGLSNTMQSLTSLILSFIHKRFIYHKNLIVPQFLDFSNSSSLFVPSSPPSSSILLPAKRYENYRRSFAFFTQKRKTSIGILEKINLHQQQRLVKRLYRFPVKESFRSEIIENRFTGFSNAALMIGSYEAILQNPSSSNMFVRNRIFKRHQNYLTNQWWNGQLPEHNAETAHSSDIDWRYTFIESIGDLLFDFPDADIHYSPRNRRWLLTKGSYQQMFSFDKTLYSEIYSHFIFESFTKAFHIFEENREVLDFYAFYILKKGLYNVKPGLTSLTLFQRLLN